MIDAILKKVRGLITNPLGTFRNSRGDDARSVFHYFLVLLLVDALLTAIISLTGLGPWGTVVRFLRLRHPVLVFFLVLVGGLILAPLFSAWLHLWVYMLGGRKGFVQSLKAVMYGATPGLLLGWIPFIGIIFHLWSMVLAIFGIHELHEIEADRAAFAVIVAVIIPLVILALVAAWLLVASVNLTVPAERPGLL
jgi:hypothetical protein